MELIASVIEVTFIGLLMRVEFIDTIKVILSWMTFLFNNTCNINKFDSDIHYISLSFEHDENNRKQK